MQWEEGGEWGGGNRGGGGRGEAKMVGMARGWERREKDNSAGILKWGIGTE
jgi:hypothetical protein